MQLHNEGHTRPNCAPSTPAPDGAGAGGGRNAYPDPRTIRRALDVLLRLPREALADVGERIIDRLDTVDGDLDLEPDQDDACQAEDAPTSRHFGIGDEDDAEPDADDEPGDAEEAMNLSGASCQPIDPAAMLHVRRQVALITTRRAGRNTKAHLMRFIPWEGRA